MSDQVSIIKRAYLNACGFSSLSDADSGQQQEMLDSLNASIQAISAFAPLNWYHTDEHSDIIRAPLSAEFTGMSQGSKDFSWSLIGTSAWAYECAVKIPGDSSINRIKKKISGQELLLPYMGSSSSVNVTIYNDVIQMPSNFMRMKGDVSIIGSSKIGIVYTNDQLGPNREDGSPQFIGKPTLARVIARIGSGSTRAAYLKLNSLPDTISRIHFEYYSRSPNVNSFDDVRSDIIPYEFTESVLIPIALQKLAEMTSLVSDSRLQRIQSSAESAYSILREVADAEGGSSPGVMRTGMW